MSSSPPTVLSSDHFVTDPVELHALTLQTSAFMWNPEGKPSYFSDPDFHAPLDSVSIYGPHPGIVPGLAEISYLVVTQKDASKNRFLYGISYDTKGEDDLYNRHEVFDETIQPALTAQYLHVIPPMQPNENLGLGDAICEFYFHESSGLTMYILHANLINRIPYYRLPKRSETEYDLMAWQVEFVKILDEFKCLDLWRISGSHGTKLKSSAEAILREQVERPIELGEILLPPFPRADNLDRMYNLLLMQGDAGVISTAPLTGACIPALAADQIQPLLETPVDQYEVQPVGKYTPVEYDVLGDLAPRLKPSKLRAYATANW